MSDMYSTFGYSGVSDTYFSVDVNGVTLVILNTSYSDQDALANHGSKYIPQSELDWLDTLPSDNPILVIQHVPISRGTGLPKDTVTGQNKIAQKLSSNKRFVEGFFGHVHHASGWDYSLTQRDAYGNEHIHTPTPNYFPDDASVVPYTKVRAWNTGEFIAEASYTANNTERRTSWGNASQRNETPNPGYESFAANLTPIKYQLRGADDFDFTTGAGTISSGTGYAAFDTGATSGQISRGIKYQDPNTHPEYGAWGDAPLMFRTHVNWKSTSDANQDIWLLWGAIGGDGTAERFGFRVSDDTIRGTVSDNIGESTTTAVTLPMDRNTLVAAMYPGEQVDFWVEGNSQDGTYLGSVTENLPTGANNLQNAVFVDVQTSEAASKEIWVSEWQTFVGGESMQPLSFLTR